MRYLSPSDVRKVLPMPLAIDAMRLAFTDDVEFPQRVLLGRSLFMPGRVGQLSGIKVVSTIPGKPVGTVIVFDAEGTPLGMVDGPTLTAIRTGAGAGLATDLLASPSATSMAMLGAGAMAYDQVEAVRAVRTLTDIRIWSRSGAKADALAARFNAGRPVASANDAVSGADIISTATPSRSPLFDHSAVGDATVHLNAVGAFTPDMVEIPGSLVRRCFRVVDDVDAARAEAGDLLQAGVEPDATMADLLHGRVEAPKGTTMFKSVGIASQDVAAAVAAIDAAENSSAGIKFG